MGSSVPSASTRSATSWPFVAEAELQVRPARAPAGPLQVTAIPVRRAAASGRRRSAACRRGSRPPAVADTVWLMPFVVVREGDGGAVALGGDGQREVRVGLPSLDALPGAGVRDRRPAEDEPPHPAAPAAATERSTRARAKNSWPRRAPPASPRRLTPPGPSSRRTARDCRAAARGRSSGRGGGTARGAAAAAPRR